MKFVRFTASFFLGIMVAVAVFLYFLGQIGVAIKETNEGFATLVPQQVTPVIVTPVSFGEVMATIAAQPLTNAAAPPQPTPTAYFAPATATPEFSPQFLADCALAQGQGRRTHPRCPTNAAEMLGTGR